MLPSRLLLSGVPACAKTTFGDWLKDNHGYHHIDMETWDRTEVVAKLVWDRNPAEAARVFAEGFDSHTKLVLSWGFVPMWHCIWMVRHLVDTQSFVPWWFYGEMDAARQAWLSRERSSDPTAFNTQVCRIGEAWPELAEIYGPRTLVTLRRDGAKKEYKNIFNHIDNHHR